MIIHVNYEKKEISREFIRYIIFSAFINLNYFNFILSINFFKKNSIPDRAEKLSRLI